MFAMKRKEKLERIIIGTLLESREGRNFYDDCRSVITAYMFGNDICRRIYGYIQDMNRNGKEDTTPLAILDEYGADAMGILYEMVGLCTDYSFIHLKTRYNEQSYLVSIVTGYERGYTNVGFIEYVKEFIKLAYEERDGSDGAEGAAA